MSERDTRSRLRRIVAAIVAGFAFGLFGLIGLGPAEAAAPITLFAVPGTVSAYPNQITAGPDGNLWFTETNTNAVGRIDVSAPHRTQIFPLPASSESPFYIVPGPDRNLWFATGGSERYQVGGTRGAIGRVLSAAPNTVTEYPLPSPTSVGGVLVVGSDRNLWFTDAPGQGAPAGAVSKIGRMDPLHPGAMQEYPLRAGLSVTSMLAGRRADIWFGGLLGDTKAGVLGHFFLSDPATVQLTIIPGQGAFYGGVFSLIWGPDNNLWFSQYAAVTRATPTAEVHFYTLPINVEQEIGLVTGPDGNIWFARANVGVASLNRLAPAYPYDVTPFLVPGDAAILSPQRLAVGADHNLWATIGTNDGKTPGYIAQLSLAH